MQPKTLDSFLQRYFSGRLSYMDFVRHIMQYTYFFILKRHALTLDDCGGFLLFFYPTIQRIIYRYQEMGRSFEAYLDSYIKFQLKSYFRKMGKENLQHASIVYQEKIALTYSIANDIITDRQYAVIPSKTPLDILYEIYQYLQKNSVRLCMGFRKRVFIFVVKFIDRWKTEDIELVSEQFSFDGNRLLGIRQLALEQKDRRLTRIKKFEEQRNTLLTQLNQIQMQNAYINRIDAQQMEVEKKYQARLNSINKRIQAIPRSLSNSDISNILGLPKGTIDSSMYLLKKTVKRYTLKGVIKEHSHL